MLEPLRLLAAAIQFLTRIPVPGVRVGPDDLRRAAALFPLVGLVVAGVGIGVRAGLEPLWGRPVGTLAALAAMIAVTGALHEDGLADTADGLWGGADAARRLEIMRDSRIGTYGAVALVSLLSLRGGLLLDLGLADFARAVACGHVLGRASTLVLTRLLPVAAPAPTAAGPAGAADVAGEAVGSSAEAAAGPAGDTPTDPAAAEGALRPPGLAAAVVGPLSIRGAVTAVVVVAGTVIVAAGAWAPVPLAAGLLVCLLCAGLFRRRLGGISGDALGAANTLVDLAAIATVAALVRHGQL